MTRCERQFNFCQKRKTKTRSWSRSLFVPWQEGTSTEHPLHFINQLWLSTTADTRTTDMMSKSRQKFCLLHVAKKGLRGTYDEPFMFSLQKTQAIFSLVGLNELLKVLAWWGSESPKTSQICRFLAKNLKKKKKRKRKKSSAELKRRLEMFSQRYR